MVKRMLDATTSDFEKMGRADLLESIRLAEGRTVCAEVVAISVPLVHSVTNAETAAAFGADLISLNGYDVQNPMVMGAPGKTSLNLADLPIPIPADFPLGLGASISDIKRLVGRPVGTKLDCVPPERRDEFGGRAATADNARRAVELGADFLWLAGNPGTGASTQLIAQGVAEVAEAVGDQVIIIAGKMHGAGLGRADVVSEEAIRRYAEAGADIIVVPAPGTVPGATLEYTKGLVEAIHAAGPLAMTGMGTSQEGADVETVRQIALMSKMTGADILHIGDAGFSGMAPPENIIAFSIAVRGQRHTYRRMALSLRR
jgi:hypothetical protein